MKHIQIFDELKEIFNNAGYRLYIIGGTSRNLLLDLDIDDYDFVTDATPEEEKTFLKDANYTFEKYGSVSLKMNNVKCDIVTLRKESTYDDSRHPKKIEFIKSIEQDYLRRDFTINAIYIDEKYNIINPANGLIDLENKIIRVIGNVEERIKEDPLRMIRAYRFSIVLDFEIEEELKEFIINNYQLLQTINKDKIKEEFKKIKNHIK